MLLFVLGLALAAPPDSLALVGYGLDAPHVRCEALNLCAKGNAPGAVALRVDDLTGQSGSVDCVVGDLHQVIGDKQETPPLGGCYEVGQWASLRCKKALNDHPITAYLARPRGRPAPVVFQRQGEASGPLQSSLIERVKQLDEYKALVREAEAKMKAAADAPARDGAHAKATRDGPVPLALTFAAPTVFSQGQRRIAVQPLRVRSTNVESGIGCTSEEFVWQDHVVAFEVAGKEEVPTKIGSLLPTGLHGETAEVQGVAQLEGKLIFLIATGSEAELFTADGGVLSRLQAGVNCACGC